MRDIYIIGAGGHGKVVLDIINKSRQYQAAAFLDDDSSLHNEIINGLKVLGGSKEALADDKAVIIAVGNNKIREKLFKMLKSNDLEIINAVHPDAVINSFVSTSKGIVVAAGAVINPNAVIEDNVIINTGVTVDHDCIIERHVHLSPGVNLGGNVKVQRGAHIGIGAAVLPGIKIGRNSVVGAGAVVTKDVPNDVTVVGVPARVHKS
jgi:sugar O-acyltransferase (sialic acid O-acetyltransferase NeuD family)